MTNQFNLLQIASRQITPNMLAWLSLRKHKMLGRTVLMHTDDELESRQPAEEITRLIQSIEVDAANETYVVQQPVDANAQSVYQTALELLSEDPSRRWVINATGGNKPMSVALHMLASHAQVAAVIYRDYAVGWQMFRVARDGVPEDLAIPANHILYTPFVQSPGMLSDVPLIYFLRAQFSDSKHLVNLASTQIPEFDLGKSVQQARSGMQWQSIMHRHDLPMSSDGTAFEVFVAAMLRAAGVDEVMCGLTGHGESGAMLETDVIACHGNRLMFVDIKLTDSPKKTEQIRVIHSTAKKYGGLSACAVLLRPLWPGGKQTLDFAAALQTPLIYRANRLNMFQILLKQLGINLIEIAHTPAADAIALLMKSDNQQMERAFRHRAL